MCVLGYLFSWLRCCPSNHCTPSIGEREVGVRFALKPSTQPKRATVLAPRINPVPRFHSTQQLRLQALRRYHIRIAKFIQFVNLHGDDTLQTTRRLSSTDPQTPRLRTRKDSSPLSPLRPTMAWTQQGRSIFAFAVVLSLLSTAAVALRFVCRGRILHVLGLTDWFLLLTLACAPEQQ